MAYRSVYEGVAASFWVVVPAAVVRDLLFGRDPAGVPEPEARQEQGQAGQDEAHDGAMRAIWPICHQP